MQITEYIHDHLTDPNLGPEHIARALDISVRWAHSVFNTEDESIARSIRNQRADGVAALLRSQSAPLSTSELSRQFGFTSRESLVRAFRSRYGSTVREYQQLHHRLSGTASNGDRPTT